MDRYNNELINKMSKIFCSNNVSSEDKKYLFKLRTIYLKNLKLGDLKKIENDLYKGKDKYEKVDFELDRIRLKITTEGINDVGIEESVYSIFKNVVFSVKSNGMDDEVYDGLIKCIIKLEVLLNLPIGLFVEFNDFVEEIVDDYMYLVDDSYDKENKMKEEKSRKRV